MSPACLRWTSKIIEKLSHNFAATLDFLLVGRTLGLSAYTSISDRPGVVKIYRGV
jgi:hypothetical protein